MPSLAASARALVAALAALAPFQPPTLPGGWHSSGPALYEVNAVAADPARDGAVYAAASIYSASQSAIFYSADGGATWDPLVQALNGEFYSTILVDPRQPSRVYAGALGPAGTGNLYLSADSGTTWTLTRSVSPSCSPSFAVASAANTVLAACGSKLLRSQDGGASWSELTAPASPALKLVSGGPGAILAYGTSQVFRTANDGSSWTSIASAPAACPGILALRVDPANAQVLVAGAGSVVGGVVCGGVFRSSDGGHSWGGITLPGYYVTDVVIDSRSSSTLFAAASYLSGVLPRGGVFESRDGGASWATLRLPASGALRLALSATGRYLHAATPIGVFDRGFRRTTVAVRDSR